MNRRTVNIILAIAVLAMPVAATSQSMIQVDKLFADDSASGDGFGGTVAISGDTAVIGALNNNGLGAAYVFSLNGTSWVQQAKLVADDGATGDQFGDHVAISGETIVVSAAGDDELGSAAGAAYVFVRNGTTWTQQAKLLADDGAADDRFGGHFSHSGDQTVAVEGDTIIVGATEHDELVPRVGAAYVFVRNGTVWTQQAKLL